MSATKAQISRAIADYHKEIINEVEKRCKTYCNNLIWWAIRYRKTAFDAHDFTGNLLNSIVVCLYKKREPQTAFYAAEKGIPKAISAKMSRDKRGRKRYHFDPDYSGAVSDFRADVETDRGWGENDARIFFNSFRPNGNNIFDIVVAYPVEYAEWVEEQRGTTGILNAYAEAQNVGMVLLQLPRKA